MKEVYKGFLNLQKHLENSIEIDIVSKLTEGDENCALSIISKPRTNCEKELVEKGRLLTQPIALYSGKEDKCTYLYDLKDKKSYYKFSSSKFFLQTQINLGDVWKGLEDIQHYTFKGEQEELFKAFRSKYIFPSKMIGG